MQSSFGTIKVYISVHFLLLAKGCRLALTVWTGSLSNMAKKKSLIHVICSPNSLHNCHKQTKLAISFPLTISKLILLTLCQQQNGPAHPHNLSLFSCSHHRSQNCLRTFIWGKYFHPKTNVCPVLRPAPPFPVQVATSFDVTRLLCPFRTNELVFFW